MSILKKYQYGNTFKPNLESYGEDSNWLGDKYRDVGFTLKNKKLSLNVGNYLPIVTREKPEWFSPYINLGLDLKKNKSISLDAQPDYVGLNFTKTFADGGEIKNNLFNRTFRDRALMKQEILNENPVLKNVMSKDDMNINYARLGQRKLLEKAGHNPEYFDKDNNQNGILDNNNDTDSGYAYNGDITLPEGTVRNPHPGEFTTLINKKGLSRDEIKNIAANDFTSHALHYDEGYNNFSKQLEGELTKKWSKDMIEGNGGVDGYMRAVLDPKNPGHEYHIKEMQHVDPKLLEGIRSYVKTGKYKKGGMLLYKKGGNLPQKGKIECHNPKCDWSWDIKDAGKDKYVCHECGTDNTKFYGSGGTIHIDKNKRGTFTAAATKHGMGVQEFASKVLADKSGKYSSLLHKKANFAKNATKFKH